MTPFAMKTAPVAYPSPLAPSFEPAFEPAFEPVEYANQRLLRAIVESWIDGILILTAQRQWVEANTSAQQICKQLRRSQPHPSPVPEVIWQVCQELIQSRQTFSQSPVVIESDIQVEGVTLRIRVRWFGVEETDRPFLMVILEDRYQSNVNRAIAEVDQYHLSPREAEVWMLYRTGRAYKEIAQELYISCDTVKKHLRSIRAKQQKTKAI